MLRKRNLLRKWKHEPVLVQTFMIWRSRRDLNEKFHEAFCKVSQLRIVKMFIDMIVVISHASSSKCWKSSFMFVSVIKSLHSLSDWGIFMEPLSLLSQRTLSRRRRRRWERMFSGIRKWLGKWKNRNKFSRRRESVNKWEVDWHTTAAEKCVKNKFSGKQQNFTRTKAVDEKRKT